MSLRGMTVRRAIAVSALAGAVIVGLSGAGHSILAQTPAPTPSPAATVTVSGPTPASNLGGPAAVPSARFFGTVTSTAGGILPGTPVNAYVGGTLCGSGTVSGNQYSVDVQATQGCSTPGATVTFTVGGQPASPSGTLPALQGTAVSNNLTVGAPSPTAAPATPAPATPAVTPRPAAPSATARAATATAIATLSPEDQRRAATLTVSGDYISGPRQLTVGSTTRVQVTLTQTNNYTEPVHYGKTVAADIGGGVTVVSASATGGSAGTSNPSVLTYSVDTLSPGESSALTAVLDVNPPASAVGTDLPLYTNVSVDAVTDRGLKVNYSMGPVTASIIRGLVANGQVAGAAASAPSAGVATAPRPVVVTGGLPTTGTGTLASGDASSEVSRFPLTLLLAIIAVGVGLLGVVRLSTKWPAS